MECQREKKLPTKFSYSGLIAQWSEARSLVPKWKNRLVFQFSLPCTFG